MAKTIKGIIDTPILTKNGELTDESEARLLLETKNYGNSEYLGSVPNRGGTKHVL